MGVFLKALSPRLMLAIAPTPICSPLQIGERRMAIALSELRASDRESDIPRDAERQKR
jgi:hypothetical protein